MNIVHAQTEVGRGSGVLYQETLVESQIEIHLTLHKLQRDKLEMLSWKTQMELYCTEEQWELSFTTVRHKNKSDVRKHGRVRIR